MKRIVSILLLVAITLCMLAGCDSDYQEQTSDVEKQHSITKELQQSQPTPTDIDYSLERYNLIRRAYWVNGQREKALSLPCPVEKPLGYVVLMLEGVGVVGNYVIDGKVSSLNSFLTPDSEYYEYSAGETSKKNNWLADVDGSYGENDNGIFFFTTDGKYIEWTGTYIYSDIPYIVDDPILKVQEEN
ncbi:putative uncharacterized protein [Clostridium sp. CAG:793]|nr:putative uncharacterized protein [Clostridium sp. CAG:793]